MILSIPSVTVILTKITSLILFMFTYVLPLLSSIRAVHNCDKESYHQWVTYFLLLFGLVSPLTSLITFHPVFQLTIILWLSLPRFQGAHYVYTQFIRVFVIEKYDVEKRVDGEIQRVKQSLKRAVWNILQDMGWCALAQVGDVVVLLKALMPSDNAVNEGGDMNQRHGRDDGDDDDGDDDEDEDDDDVVGGDGGRDNDTAAEEEEASDIEVDNTWQGTKPINDHDPSPSTLLENRDASPLSHRQVSDQGSNIKLTSSCASLSSLRSSHRLHEDDEHFLDDNDTGENNDVVAKSYVQDLTQMLQNGLYVYASHGYGVETDVDGNKDSKSFRLSLFSYHPLLSIATMDDDSNSTSSNSYHDCFVFSPQPSSAQTYESQSEELAKDSAILPLNSVVQIRKVGVHTIEFVATLSALEREPQQLQDLQRNLSASFTSGMFLSTQPECSNVSEEELETLMKSCSAANDSSENLQQQVMEDDKEEEVVFAKMALLDGEDRDTLFTGLTTLTKIFGRYGGLNNYIREEEALDNQGDVEGDLSDNDSLESVMDGKDIDIEDKEDDLGIVILSEEMDRDGLVGLPNDLESKKIEQNDALDNDDPNNDQSFVNELATVVDDNNHPPSNKNCKEAELSSALPDRKSWGNGVMEDDQVLSDGENM